MSSVLFDNCWTARSGVNREAMNDLDKNMYRLWLRKGLEKPGKSQRGLAKVLKIDPMAVSRLVAGTRRFQLDELPKIAYYIDEPLPEIGLPLKLSSTTSRGICVMGRVSSKTWQEGDVDLGEIAGVVDRRFPIEHQRAFLVDENMPNFNVTNGSYLVCVSYGIYGHYATDGALCVAERARDGLKNYTLHQVGQKLAPGHELTWLVIAITQPMI